ncbi:MAG: hypothetical protein ABI619_08430, partial [Betaproteobacteria bacterium]
MFIFFANASEHRFEDTLLWEMLDRYPYLAVVVVGGPADERVKPHTLGGVFYLPHGASPELVAFEASRALNSTWWWGVSGFDLPFVVVDRDGIVARANNAAIARFGNVLVGKPYRTAIEHSGSAEFPAGHPVLQAMDAGTAISGYYEYQDAQRRAHWRNLICRPIPGLQGTIRAVAVLLIEMNRWARIVEAQSVFDKRDTLSSLYEAIVEQAQQLGFARARLYELSDHDDTLYARASV